VLFVSLAALSQETSESVNVILTGVKAYIFGLGRSIARGQLPARGALECGHFTQRADRSSGWKPDLARQRIPDRAAKESEAVTFP
jgi:hypothetical protein